LKIAPDHKARLSQPIKRSKAAIQSFLQPNFRNC
jgi:hypothetical protein